MNLIEQFYLEKKEPTQGCLLVLRELILGIDEKITEHWKYNTPFFYYSGRMYCYLWIDKKTQWPYIGLVDGDKMDHPALFQGNRKRMKILFVNPADDIPIETVQEVLVEALSFRKQKEGTKD